MLEEKCSTLFRGACLMVACEAAEGGKSPPGGSLGAAVRVEARRDAGRSCVGEEDVEGAESEW